MSTIEPYLWNSSNSRSLCLCVLLSIPQFGPPFSKMSAVLGTDESQSITWHYQVLFINKTAFSLSSGAAVVTIPCQLQGIIRRQDTIIGPNHQRYHWDMSRHVQSGESQPDSCYITTCKGKWFCPKSAHKISKLSELSIEDKIPLLVQFIRDIIETCHDMSSVEKVNLIPVISQLSKVNVGFRKLF